MNANPAEIARLLENLIRIGTVTEVDLSGPIHLARVQSGDLQTNWLPMPTRSAGGDRETWPVERDEQVVLLSPGGDMARAVIAFSINQTNYPALSTNGDVHRITYKNGDVVEHNRSDGSFSIKAQGNVSVTTEKQASVQATGNVSVVSKADVSVQAQGNLQATAASVSLQASGDISIQAGGAVTINGSTVSLN